MSSGQSCAKCSTRRLTPKTEPTTPKVTCLVFPFLQHKQLTGACFRLADDTGAGKRCACPALTGGAKSSSPLAPCCPQRRGWSPESAFIGSPVTPETALAGDMTTSAHSLKCLWITWHPGSSRNLPSELCFHSSKGGHEFPVSWALGRCCLVGQGALPLLSLKATEGPCGLCLQGSSRKRVSSGCFIRRQPWRNQLHPAIQASVKGQTPQWFFMFGLLSGVTSSRMCEHGQAAWRVLARPERTWKTI